MKKFYQFVIIATIPADSFEEAKDSGKTFISFFNEDMENVVDPISLSLKQEQDYELDGENNRIYEFHLHPEHAPISNKEELNKKERS